MKLTEEKMINKRTLVNQNMIFKKLQLIDALNKNVIINDHFKEEEKLETILQIKSILIIIDEEVTCYSTIFIKNN